MDKHAFVIAADKSNSGKTTITIGIVYALKEMGYRVAPFKCGPDYIDTAHLSRVANYPAYNLDSLFLSKDELKDTFLTQLTKNDIGVIEGVMGFFDGIDYKTFKASTYDIASMLNLPAFLVLDGSSSSFSLAATVKGINQLSKNVPIKGVIVNNIASYTHENMVVNSIEYHTDTKILGVIYKDELIGLPSRHLGVYMSYETSNSTYEKAAKAVKQSIDIKEIVRQSPVYIQNVSSIKSNASSSKTAFVAYDEAFNFYYQNNLDILRSAGYDIQFFSPIKNEMVENADFVYLGGGYPELFADKLSQSTDTINSIQEHINANRPLLAECGGMIYLTKGIHKEDGKFYKFCGVFDAECRMSKKRSALGYVYVEGLGRLKGINGIGHEFHYSYLTNVKEPYIFKIKKLTTNEERFDGFLKNSALASYTHFCFSKKNEWILDFLGGAL